MGRWLIDGYGLDLLRWVCDHWVQYELGCDGDIHGVFSLRPAKNAGGLADAT